MICIHTYVFIHNNSGNFPYMGKVHPSKIRSYLGPSPRISRFVLRGLGTRSERASTDPSFCLSAPLLLRLTAAFPPRTSCPRFSSLPPRREREGRPDTPSAPTKSLGFRGFDSSRLLILRGGNSHVR